VVFGVDEGLAREEAVFDGVFCDGGLALGGCRAG